MRVLIACEYSGIVRDAFARRGKQFWGNQTPSGQNRLGPGPSKTRAKERSKTYEGIANMMAYTWG